MQYQPSFDSIGVMTNPHSLYRLTFDVRKGYLYARVEATAIDRQTSLEYLSEISLKCADLRMKRLLLERDIPVILDDSGMDSIIGEYIRLSAGVTIAMVNRFTKLNTSTEYIIQQLNARGAHFKYFDNVREAEEWLVAQPITDLFS